MSRFDLVSFDREPERFLDRLSARAWRQADPVSFPLASRYYQAYAAAAWQGDGSFLVLERDQPVAFVRAHAVDGVLGDNGRGVTIELGDSDPGPTPILRGLEETARRLGARRLLVADRPSGAELSPLGRRLLLTRAQPTLRPFATLDLSPLEARLRAALRDSYRSLINWGLREMRFDIHRGSGFDRQALARFHDFHATVAGRETRSLETWDIQGELIARDRAELVMGYLPGHDLVAGLLLFDWGATTVYASAVYDRALFDKPLAHAGLFAAILRAKARGQQFFLMGEIPPAGSASDKEVSIGFFKAGFTDRAGLAIEWELDLPHD